MQKIQVLDAVANRYYVGATTSGSTQDIYLTDGVTTVKLEDCLIWDSESFEDKEFYDIVERCKADAEEMREMGWSIIG